MGMGNYCIIIIQLVHIFINYTKRRYGYTLWGFVSFIDMLYEICTKDALQKNGVEGRIYKLMTTLKDAQKDPKKLEQFIKEREKDTPQGDADKFDQALKSMTEEKKSKDR